MRTVVSIALILLCGSAPRQVVAEDDFKNDEKPSTFVPKFTSRPTESDVRVGDTLQLNCSVDKMDAYALIWSKGTTMFSVGTMAFTQGGRFHLQEDFSLNISDIRIEDDGDYICRISTKDPMMQVHKINVLYPPSLLVEPHSPTVAANSSDNVTLECTAIGKPTPRVVWHKIVEDHHTHNITKKFLLEGSILHLQNVSHLHRGNYECTASNGEGEPVQHNFHVKIHHKPVIDISNRVVTSSVEVIAEIACVVIASPIAEVSWYHNGKLLNETNYKKGRKHGEHVYFIDNVSSKDYGNYTCSAVNSYGMVLKVTHLSGIASPILITSGNHSTLVDSYTVVFQVDSITPIIEQLLNLRRIKGPDGKENLSEWKEVVIPMNSQYDTHHGTRSYKIVGLEPRTTYELYIQARTKDGLSKKSAYHSFVTGGDETPSYVEEIYYTTNVMSGHQTVEQSNNSNGATSNHIEERVRTAAVLTVVILTAFFY